MSTDCCREHPAPITDTPPDLEPLPLTGLERTRCCKDTPTTTAADGEQD